MYAHISGVYFTVFLPDCPPHGFTQKISIFFQKSAQVVDLLSIPLLTSPDMFRTAFRSSFFYVSISQSMISGLLARLSWGILLKDTDRGAQPQIFAKGIVGGGWICIGDSLRRWYAIFLYPTPVFLNEKLKTYTK